MTSPTPSQADREAAFDSELAAAVRDHLAAREQLEAISPAASNGSFQAAVSAVETTLAEMKRLAEREDAR